MGNPVSLIFMVSDMDVTGYRAPIPSLPSPDPIACRVGHFVQEAEECRCFRLQDTEHTTGVLKKETLETCPL
ncbi:hypothetical protein ACROYT_G015909 [Oculina patagonica]